MDLVRGLGRAALLLSLTGIPACSLVGYPGGGPSSEGGRPTIVPAGGGEARGSTVSRPAGAAGDRPIPAGAVPTGGAEDPSSFVIPDGVRLPDNGRTYEVFGVEYRVVDDPTDYDEVGVASWYGPEFHGRPTSSGESYDQYGLSAAHRTLPLHTFVEVTNTLTGESVVLRINDRGPFASTHERIIDVSYGAALRLSVVEPGTAPVRVRVIGGPR